MSVILEGKMGGRVGNWQEIFLKDFIEEKIEEVRGQTIFLTFENKGWKWGGEMRED